MGKMVKCGSNQIFWPLQENGGFTKEEPGNALYEGQRIKSGRPFRYGDVLKSLPENRLFSPRIIAEWACARGKISREAAAIRRLRMSMSSLSLVYFSRPDGFVGSDSGVLDRCWFGYRWREIHKNKAKNRKGRKRRRRAWL